MKSSPLFFLRVASGLLLLAVTACGPARQNQMPPPGPVDVVVVTINPHPIMLTTELPGRLSPYRIADVRPQVSGVIQKRLFTEGGEVQEGQQLYQIDPAPYQAALDSAQAQLEHAQGALISAQSLYDRDKPLVETHAVSKQDFDSATAGLEQAKADVASGQAAVDTAKVNLVYTKVLSPITGRTGRSVTEGALVTANQTNVLVTVQQLDPIFVDIPQSMALLLRLQRELAEGKLKGGGPNQAQVKLTLEDGSNYEVPGKLEFSESTVEQSTGSVILRASFANPKHILLPGMFVRAELEEGMDENGMLVPQRAVTHDPQGQATCLVVTTENKVELRPLKTQRAVKDQWLVSEGINPGDRVIVEGLQKVMPGATVRATEAGTDTAATPAATPAP